MKPRLLSVVIPAYNAVDLIDGQLTALASQDYQGKFEVIVSDNGSQDNLEAHIKSHPLTEQLTMSWVDSTGIQGCGHARNVGVAKSNGDFVVFCDADDRVHSGWMTAVADAADTADAVGGAVEITSTNSAKVAGWRDVSTDDLMRYETFLPFTMGCNFGMWRTVFDEMGGFDVEYRHASEDIDMCWRLQLAGHTLVHAPDALVAYQLRDTYRGTWKQMKSYGYSTTQLYTNYRQHGFRRTSARNAILTVVGLVILNPLVPVTVTKVPRGRWFAHAGFFAGKLRASIDYRIFFV